MTRHQHLTDEDFYQLLDGDKTISIGECTHCQQEFNAIHASLAGFRDAAIHLAAATPLPAFDRQPALDIATPRRMFTRKGLMAAGASAVVLVGVSVSSLVPRHGAAVTVVPPTAVATAENSVSDEALLDGISQDLSASVPPSLAPLALPTTSTNK